MSELLRNLNTEDIADLFRDVVGSVQEDVELAREIAYDQGESHRGVYVADVARAIRETPSGLALVQITGANFKQKDPVHPPIEHEDDIEAEMLRESGVAIPSETPKVCAEMSAMIQGEDENQLFLSHTVVGTPRRAEIEGIIHKSVRILPPCKECYETLEQNPQILPSTIFISASYHEDIYQVRNPRLLKALHRSSKPDNTPVMKLSAEGIRRAVNDFDSRIEKLDYRGRNPIAAISAIAMASLIQR